MLAKCKGSMISNQALAVRIRVRDQHADFYVENLQDWPRPGYHETDTGTALVPYDGQLEGRRPEMYPTLCTDPERNRSAVLTAAMRRRR